MAGQSVLQTNSPANKVTMALNSANKSKAVSWKPSKFEAHELQLTFISSLVVCFTRSELLALPLSISKILLDCKLYNDR